MSTSKRLHRSREEILSIVAATPLFDANPIEDPNYFRRVAMRKLMTEYELTGEEPDFLDKLGQCIVLRFIDGGQAPITINLVTHEAPAQPGIVSRTTTQPAPTVPKTAKPAKSAAKTPAAPVVSPAQLSEEDDVEIVEETEDIEVLDVPAELPPIQRPPEIVSAAPWAQLLWDKYVGEHRWEYIYRADAGGVYTEGDSKRGGMASKMIFSYDPRKAAKTGATPYKGVGGDALPSFVTDYISPKEPSGAVSHHFTFFDKHLKSR